MTPILPFTVYFCSAFFSVPYSPHRPDVQFVDRSDETVATIAKGSGGWATQYLVIMPSGVQINLATGEVKLPDSVKLEAASREFWLALATEFPHVRDAWVVGYEAGKRSGWNK